MPRGRPRKHPIQPARRIQDLDEDDELDEKPEPVLRRIESREQIPRLIPPIGVKVPEGRGGPLVSAVESLRSEPLSPAPPGGSWALKPEPIEEPEEPEEPELDDDFFEENDPGYVVQEDKTSGQSTKVYHDGGTTTVPNKQAKSQRNGISVGPIIEREIPPDLVGDRPPRTLTDLYARWPVATNPDFFMRIERTKPKRYAGIDVAGFVGEIRGREIQEVDIQRMYGGTEYAVVLYGPDPRMSEDENGNVKIKALSEPIVITVPVYPPNVSALPGTPIPTPGLVEETTPMLSNPFMAPPVSTGEAAIHKTNTAFFSEVTKMQHADSQRRESEAKAATSAMFDLMSKTQSQQVSALQQTAERQEQQMKEQIAELKQALEAEKRRKVEVAETVAKTKDEANRHFMEFVTKMGPDKEAEIRRLSEYYTQQTEVLRRSHDDQLKSLRDRYDSDLRRSDERVKESESNYRLLLEQERTQSRQMLDQERTQSRQMLEQERAQWTQREKDLREQMDKQTQAERNMAAQRITDMKERHDAEMRQMERAHERELRTLKEAADTKLTVSEKTSQMTLQHAMERAEEAKKEVERIREELEAASDLTTQLEKAERQAELLGFKKEGADAPKGPWERFASVAGAGVSQALATANEWVPQLMATRREQQQHRDRQQVQMQQLQERRRVAAQQAAQQQAAQQAQQQAQPRAQRRSTSVQWAAAGVRIESPETFETQEQRPRASQPPAPVAVMAPPIVDEPPSGLLASVSDTIPAPAPVPDEMQAPEEEPQATNGQIHLPVPPKFLEYFPEEALLGFLQQAEHAVNHKIPPSDFASLMLAQFGDGARTLYREFKPEEISEAVEQIPGAETSAFLRRDGKKWLSGLWAALKDQDPEKTELTASA